MRDFNLPYEKRGPGQKRFDYIAHVAIPQHTHNLLWEMAEKKGASLSAVLRFAILSFVDTYGQGQGPQQTRP